MDPAAFIKRWLENSSGSERANKDPFLGQLCAVIDVPHPDPKTNDPDRDVYVFEADVLSVHEGGKTTTLKADLYKRGCFILEAKQGSKPGDAKVGSARRGTPGWNQMMQNACGQAVGYARSMDDPPPFIVTCDIGYVFELYADFDRSGYYLPFPNAQKNKLFLADLVEHTPTLRAVFLDPWSLDPSQAKVKVTRKVAEHLAEVAKYLEKENHSPELIAKFLMRCLFTMFAEDVDLLPDDMFTKTLEKVWIPHPKKFKLGIETLWRAMNDGMPFGAIVDIPRFNGGLFADSSALPLGPVGLERLLEAAKCEWSDVEPAIFGTLLERALSEKERHKLGAHFTPRAYVERLVRPTVEEPLRTEWENVQTAVHKLQVDGKMDAAKDAVHAFHQTLCETRVLDPACGSGNFLYVTMNIFKQIESEVLSLLADLGEKQEQLLRVTPKQFLGIEVKPWAKEIAELVLWIGYLQWHYRTHGKGMPPPVPVLQDFKNIECRDAVLTWDGAPMAELLRDQKGKPIARWDGVTLKKSPITGEKVPDEAATLPVYTYPNPTRAQWPEAHFIVGNPPFVGNKRMRAALGDGYVEALRTAHDDVPETADFVMYWWNESAKRVAAGKCAQFGLITTNSVTQTFNRQILAKHLTQGLSLLFAVPDHPWVDSADGAAVRIAMTSASRGANEGLLASVVAEEAGAHGEVDVEISTRRGVIHEDLSVGPHVASALPLRSNSILSFQGVIPLGDGFRLTETNLKAVGCDRSSLPPVVRRFVIGRDLVQRYEERWVIDFFGLSEVDAKSHYPALYQHLLVHVKPERDQNRRDTRRKNWWLFGENAPKMRRALGSLRRFIATIETSKHKPFIFLDGEVVADHKVYAVASDDAHILGVLSSRVHRCWALAAGGHLGVGNDPTWTNTTCFLPFPFPAATSEQKGRVRALGEHLDAHRKAQQVAHPDLTLTGMYNVLEKLRSGAELTDKDRDIHERGLVSLLKKIHDDLDAAVFAAYGWPLDLTDEQILEKLVALNAERAAEESEGLVRWLRPDFQNPTGKKPSKQGALALDDEAEEAPPPSKVKAWPKKIALQITAIRDRVAVPGKVFSVESVATAFKGAVKKDVEGILDGFAALGVLTAFESTKGRRWRAAGKAT